MKKYVPGIILIILGIVYSGCGSTRQIESKFTGSGGVIIDGNDKEWEGRTTFLKDDNILVGTQNDNENLYMLISTVDRQKQFQILRGGLTIWLDDKGGENKQFGIRYPLEAEVQNMQVSLGRNQPDQDISNGLLQNIPPEIEIYEPSSKGWTKTGLNETGGISLKLAKQSGRLVYELRIPFRTLDNSFNLQTDKDMIGVGIETNQFDKENFRERNNSGGREGGGRMPGGGGGMPSGGGHRRGGANGGPREGSRPSMPKAIKEWVVVSLSQK